MRESKHTVNWLSVHSVGVVCSATASGAGVVVHVGVGVGVDVAVTVALTFASKQCVYVSHILL
jgi:hypothetical protein